MPETLADQLERESVKLDRLIYDARLLEGRMSSRPHDETLHALEERAQAIGSAIVAPFRGRTAVAAPLRIVTRGNRTRALW